MSDERLQKVLARAGVASRRRAEELIRAGRVRVDGRIVTELGTRVDTADRIEVDGRSIAAEPLRYVLLHKPRGMVTTASDPEGRRTVVAHLGAIGVRVVPVGRLDLYTSGVLLLSNDGDFVARLGHPSGGAEKEYLVELGRELSDEELEVWRRPIEVDGKWTRPAAIRRLPGTDRCARVLITLHEGRNRQIRRLAAAAGHRVLSLARVAFAGVRCDDLAPGEWRYLSDRELAALRRRFGVPGQATAAP